MEVICLCGNTVSFPLDRYPCDKVTAVSCDIYVHGELVDVPGRRTIQIGFIYWNTAVRSPIPTYVREGV